MTLEILVVEDTERHLEDAREYFAQLEEKGVVKVTYANTLAEAEEALDRTKYDGVISDIFFPLGEDDEARAQELRDELRGFLDPYLERHEKYRERFMPAISLWQEGKATPPAGMRVIKKAQEQGIPVIGITDSYHHGHGTQPISTTLGIAGVKLLDYNYTLADENAKEPPHFNRPFTGPEWETHPCGKDWALAYILIADRIERPETNSGEHNPGPVGAALRTRCWTDEVIAKEFGYDDPSNLRATLLARYGLEMKEDAEE